MDDKKNELDLSKASVSVKNSVPLLPAPQGEPHVLPAVEVGSIEEPAPSNERSFLSRLFDKAYIPLFIILVCLFYGRVLINFNPNMILDGREVEWTLEMDVFFWQSLRRYAELPLWNPYWHAGHPLLADPFLHTLDPKMLIPQALFGPFNGLKIGILFSMMVLGFGGWRLGRVMGLSDEASGWLGAMLAMSGQLVGYYSRTGSIGLGLSFVYVPWVIAASLALWQRQSARRTALFAISVALLFLGSNIYFFVYTIIAMGVVLVAEFLWSYMSAARKPVDKEGRQWRIFLLHAILGGLLALSITAITALPQMQLAGYLYKPLIDDNHAVGQPIESLFVNFLISDEAYYDTELFNIQRSMIGRYSYVGLLPFLFLLGVPLAWQRGRKRTIIWLLLIGLVGLTYAAGSHTPIWPLYRNLPGASTLRFPERMLGMTTISLLALAALGLDTWWQRSTQAAHLLTIGMESSNNDNSSPSAPVFSLNPMQPLLLLLAVGSLLFVYQNNKKYLKLAPRNPIAEGAMLSIQEAIGEREYHLFAPIDFSIVASSKHEIGLINPPMVWVIDRKEPLRDWLTVMHNAAEYALVLDGQGPPGHAGRTELIADYVGYDLYYLPDAMPYAFTTQLNVQPEQSLISAPQHVEAVTAQRPTPRRIHLEVTTESTERLVVAENTYPGWKVTIDGQAAQMEAFNGFLSVRTEPGTHQYRFHFDPWLPKVALLITLLGTCYAFWVVVTNRWRLRLS